MTSDPARLRALRDALEIVFVAILQAQDPAGVHFLIRVSRRLDDELYTLLHGCASNGTGGSTATATGRCLAKRTIA
jgi:hypothetical protein